MATANENNKPNRIRDQLREMVDFFEQRSKNDIELEYYDDPLTEHQTRKPPHQNK